MERNEFNHMLAWLDLRNDLVFNKIPPAKYRYYLDSALAFGEQAAARLNGQDIRQLCAQHQIAIEIKKDDGLFFTVQFRAQFEYSEKLSRRKITLYQPSLESLLAGCASVGLVMSLDTIIDIHLAHEFFHFLEYQQRPVSASLEKVCNVAIGPFRRYSTVGATSEIAAHRFCQRFHQLDYYPSYYDFLWLAHSGKQTQWENERCFAEAWQEMQAFGLTPQADACL